MAETASRGSVDRRTVLRAGIGAALALPMLARAGAERAGASGPEEDDLFVWDFGERAGEVITVEEVPFEGPQIVAYPMDPVTGTVRDETRLNQVILIRLDPASLSEETLMRSAGGVVAYSAVCTHTGCDVLDWRPASKRFKCPCHESEYDPSDAARVIGGPAPRRLPALPLKIVDGKPVAAGGFLGRVGFQIGAVER